MVRQCVRQQWQMSADGWLTYCAHFATHFRTHFSSSLKCFPLHRFSSLTSSLPPPPSSSSPVSLLPLLHVFSFFRPIFAIFHLEQAIRCFGGGVTVATPKPKYNITLAPAAALLHNFLLSTSSHIIVDVICFITSLLNNLIHCWLVAYCVSTCVLKHRLALPPPPPPTHVRPHNSAWIEFGRSLFWRRTASICWRLNIYFACCVRQWLNIAVQVSFYFSFFDECTRRQKNCPFWCDASRSICLFGRVQCTHTIHRITADKSKSKFKSEMQVEIWQLFPLALIWKYLNGKTFAGFLFLFSFALKPDFRQKIRLLWEITYVFLHLH